MTYTTAEQLGARIALAALKRDTATMTGLLLGDDSDQMRHAAAVALGALAELAIAGRPGNLTRTRDSLSKVAGLHTPKTGLRTLK